MIGLAVLLPTSRADGDGARGSAATANSPGMWRAAQASPAVTDLRADPLSAREIELRFSAASTGSGPPAYQIPVRRYVIRLSRRRITSANFAGAFALCGGACSFPATRAGGAIRLTVEDLLPNRLYYYALRPLDGAGRSGALSNVASARTRRDRVRPGRPARPSAQALRRARVQLRWRAPGSDGRDGPPVKRYVIKQSERPITSPRRFRRARSLCRSNCRFAPRRRGAQLALLVSGLCPGRRYHYAIRAKDEGGNLSPVTRFHPVRTKRRGGLICL